MVSGNSEGGMHMYVTEQRHVIVYLTISFGIVHGRIKLRTIRTSINCAHIIEVSSEDKCLFGGGTPRELAQARPNY